MGLATLAGDALRAAESTMRAERPKVPGCSCSRIFLRSEISLVLLQENSTWFHSEQRLCFAHPSQWLLTKKASLIYRYRPGVHINRGNPGGTCVLVSNLVVFLSQEKELKSGWETSVMAATYVWGSGKNVLRIEGLAIQGLGLDSEALEES